MLREKARPIAKVGAEIRKLADDMIDTMRYAEGVGLAAQQIGETRAICVVEVPDKMDRDEAGNRFHPGLDMPMVLLNPEIFEPSKKTESREEGCLSFPEIRGNITRSVEIGLRYMDLEGAKHELRVKDFLARVVQHEVDHLNGVLFIDRMSPAKKFAIKGRLARLKAEYEEME